MSDINLDFKGPFTFTDTPASIFKSTYTESEGVYLWTVKQKDKGYHLIHYVGETINFARRHKQHLNNILGLYYGIFDPEKEQSGELGLIWGGTGDLKGILVLFCNLKLMKS